MLQKLLLALLLGIFLVIYPPLKDYFELPKVVLLVSLIPIACVLYSASISSTIRDSSGISQLFTRAPILFSVLSLFISVAIFSSILADTRESFWGQPFRYQGIIFFVTLSFFAYLISKYQEIRLKPESIRKVIITAVGINVGLILLQGLAYILGMSVYTFEGRMTGLIGNPNFAGGVIALSYPYLFYHWRSNKPALLLATIAGGLAILLTDSRGAIIAFSLALLLLFLRHANKKLVLFMAVPLLAIGAYFFPQRAISHFDSREIIWQKGWQAFQEKPVFGWGIENFSKAFQSQLAQEGDTDLKRIRVDKAHNEFLEILVATGLVGATLYVSMIGYAIWILWKNRADDFVYLQLVCVLVFLLLAQVNVLSVTEYIFLFLAVGIAAQLDGRAQYG